MMRPHPLRILICSSSDATTALLTSMLSGFYVTPLSDVEEIESYLKSAATLSPHLDFILVDNQSEARVKELAELLHAIDHSSVKQARIIHLYTPTSETLSHQIASSVFDSAIVRMTKPPRKARLLRLFAGLKNIPTAGLAHQSTEVSSALDNLTTAKRTLFGNVLIAEGNSTILNSRVIH